MRPWQVPAFSKHVTVFTKCVNKENTSRVGEVIQWLKTRFTTKASRKHVQRSPRSTEGILAGEDWHVLSIWGVSPAYRFAFPIQRGGVASSFTAPCHDAVFIASHTTPLACLSPSYHGQKIPDFQNTLLSKRPRVTLQIPTNCMMVLEMVTTLLAIVIALGCHPELDGKTLLPKTQNICTIEHKESFIPSG